MNPLLNFGAFQALWAASVIGTGQGLSLLGPLLLAAYLPLHFYLSPTRRQDFLLVCIAAGAGTLIDSGYVWAGWLDFNGIGLIPHLAPLWITALWINFTLTVNHCLRVLQGKPLWAAVSGAIGVPLAYWGGAALGAAQLHPPLWLSLGGVGLAWLIACPALFEAARWLNARAQL